MTPTCLKPSCYAPPTRVCGAGSPPAGTWERPAGSWSAGSPPGSPCPCETPRETLRGWAPTPRSPPPPLPGNRRNGSQNRTVDGSVSLNLSCLDAEALNQDEQSCSMQNGAESKAVSTLWNYLNFPKTDTWINRLYFLIVCLQPLQQTLLTKSELTAHKLCGRQQECTRFNSQHTLLSYKHHHIFSVIFFFLYSLFTQLNQFKLTYYDYKTEPNKTGGETSLLQITTKTQVSKLKSQIMSQVLSMAGFSFKGKHLLLGPRPKPALF